MPEVQFFFEEIPEFSIPEKLLTEWLLHVASSEAHQVNSLNYIFCSDQYLHSINLEYLNHDYYTDIITFDNSDENGAIEGDIFISYDRVNENARLNDVSFMDELKRIMVHGLLHLLGYNDKDPQDKRRMTEKENAYLSLPQFQF